LVTEPAVWIQNSTEKTLEAWPPSLLRQGLHRRHLLHRARNRRWIQYKSNHQRFKIAICKTTIIRKKSETKVRAWQTCQVKVMWQPISCSMEISTKLLGSHRCLPIWTEQEPL